MFGDEIALHDVFRSAVRLIASRDYTAEQIDAWDPERIDLDAWIARMRTLRPYVVEDEGRIVADFANDKGGVSRSHVQLTVVGDPGAMRIDATPVFELVMLVPEIELLLPWMVIFSMDTWAPSVIA